MSIVNENSYVEEFILIKDSDSLILVFHCCRIHSQINSKLHFQATLMPCRLRKTGVHELVHDLAMICMVGRSHQKLDSFWEKKELLKVTEEFLFSF